MKFILSISICLLFLANSVQAQISFNENTPFNTLLEIAKKEDKLIFMDCYTTWCGPCKYLATKVFTEKDLGEVYNSQFINFKSDMEKGEGIDLAKRYAINLYPTLLWLNGNGEVVYRLAGTSPKEEFLKIASDIKDKENTLPVLLAKFEAGNRDPKFLEKMANVANASALPNAEIYSLAYLQTLPQSEWTKPENLTYAYGAATTFEGEVTQYLMSHESELKDKEILEYIKSNCADRELAKVLNSKSETDLQALLRKIALYSPERTDYAHQVELHFYKVTGNRSKMNSLASKYLGESEDADMLNTYAWDRFENETDKVLLKEAIVWAEKSVKLDKSYANTDTLGQLYQKVGNKKKADKWLKESKRLEAKAG